ncbi:unnamed protein product [Adineta steineri]|uniref:Ubiquitin-conjugating enzyme E2 Z n=1 Tax=Adineta steineri TaxID=433720 RepID=A0A815JKT3_9BILA|nr:unnamed protein product [Adineta steineri]
MEQVPESSSQTLIINNNGGSTYSAGGELVNNLASLTINSDITPQPTNDQLFQDYSTTELGDIHVPEYDIARTHTRTRRVDTHTRTRRVDTHARTRRIGTHARTRRIGTHTRRDGYKRRAVPTHVCSTNMANEWDPLTFSDWDIQMPTAVCITRIKCDISNIFKDPPPGIFISPDSDNLTKIHALVIGPSDTPYQGGFFYFFTRCPPKYPFEPPRCRLMTTGNNTVRFNPNIYANGKVCLSILGTSTGPSWIPALDLSSVLILIQSLMSQNPYHDEPGFEQERVAGASNAYNEIIKHETLRVAVCEMLENQNSCPKELYERICEQFFEFYDYYVQVCTENMNKDGETMQDPFNESRRQFQYASILTRLNNLRATLENNGNEAVGNDHMEP